MRKIISSLLLLSLAAPLGAQTRRGPFDSQTFPVEYVSRGHFEPTKRPVREIERIKNEPLFANLPFLKLQNGDELVKGETNWKNHKSGETRKVEDFFLKRGGQYHGISVDEKDGQRILTDWSDVSFFDWELTRINAEKLWNWSRRANERLTIEQLRTVETALLPEFAEQMSHDWQQFTEFEEFESRESSRVRAAQGQKKLIPQPGFTSTRTGDLQWPGPNFMFAGLGFDASRATFYAFQMQFGKAGVARYQKPILVGPQPVEEYYFRRSRFPNGPGISPATGARLARFQAQKARHEKFENIVNGVLRNKQGAFFN